MSTQLRRLAQAPAHSPARAKFLLAVADISGDDSLPDAGDAIVYAAPGLAESAMSVTAFNATVASGSGGLGPFLAGTLLKDLGREIVVYNDANPNEHLHKYRQVELIENSAAEGVGRTICPFVLVWSSTAPSNVLVVRTG